MTRAFLHHRQLLKELNNTHITLIHTNHIRVSDFRPISLSNVFYKFILKPLANRLLVVLPKLISLLQIAFIPNRDIYDNILIAHECFSTF